MADLFVYEFLYRGQPSKSDISAAWHVCLAQVVELPGEAPRIVPTAALTPEQARAAGFTLDKIVKGINDEALAQVEAHAKALNEAKAAKEAAEAAAREKHGAFVQVRADLEKAVAERDQAVAKLNQAQSVSS